MLPMDPNMHKQEEEMELQGWHHNRTVIKQASSTCVALPRESLIGVRHLTY